MTLMYLLTKEILQIVDLEGVTCECMRHIETLKQAYWYYNDNELAIIIMVETGHCT